MNRKDFEYLARETRKLLNAEGDSFAVPPRKAVALFLADTIVGAEGCSGFDRAKFLKACGVAS